ncbi:Gfo/Idh/MocA family oxidoreductase [Paraburkholderia azotifigens]|uniref:Gfo/Idh/MocA family protein n=1 Tax=Paraburkholderia azotifigens TaxID=2057004 RepID=UPI00316E02BB
MKSGEIDAVAIVTPPATHEFLIEAGLACGVSVVTDKPLASNAQIARRLAARALATGNKACVLFQWRGHPAFHEARRVCAANTLGRVLHVETRFHHDFLFGPATSWPWRHSADEAGAGALGDQGVHLFDLLRYALPRQWHVRAAVTGKAWNVRLARSFPVVCETEDFVDVLLTESASGAQARLFASRVDPGRRELTLAIHGTDGSLCITLDPDSGNGQSVLTASGNAVHIEHAGVDINPYPAICQQLSAGTVAVESDVASFDDGLAAQVFVEEVLSLASSAATATRCAAD